MSVLKLGEDTGIKKIREFQDELRDAINAESEVVLDFSGVRRLDLAAVQVVLASAREARERLKVLRMRGVNAAVKAQLSLCGLR